VKLVLGSVLVLGWLMASAPGLRAQAANGSKAKDANQGSGSGQNAPAANSPSSPADSTSRTKTQTNANPFPEDTSSVPVLPSRNSPGSIPGLGDETTSIPMLPEDIDPVRTPEEAGAAAEADEKTSSSSQTGLGNLLSGPDDDSTQSRKKHRDDSVIDTEPHESAKEDESVGNYYLDNHNWKGALSRFESALVLDPYNPDVYWGLAECQRHLGDFASAKENYIKVMEYDPDSHHAKDARKALNDPQIANAKPPEPARTSPQQQ
jgi:tetratricopeptide (TPR) repeat protein